MASLQAKIFYALFLARMGYRTGAYRVLVGRREGKRLLRNPSGKWKGNITLDLQESGCKHGLDRDRGPAVLHTD
jgi:hypothetical protein